MDGAGGGVQPGRNFRQPVHPLLEAVQQGEVDAAVADLEHQAGKACAGAHVDDALFVELCRTQHGGAVQHMLLSHARRVGDGGQVHDLVFLHQRRAVALQLFRAVCG